jgi:hypothetical protein
MSKDVSTACVRLPVSPRACDSTIVEIEDVSKWIWTAVAQPYLPNRSSPKESSAYCTHSDRKINTNNQEMMGKNA